MNNRYDDLEQRYKFDDDKYGKSKYRKKQKDKKVIDLGVILRYIGLCIMFSIVIYGMKLIVLAATNASPTGQVGNGILSLYEVHNSGAAFSLFQGQSEMLIMASFLTVAILAFIVITMSTKLTQSAVSSFAFLSSGIVMNLVERISQGYVIDYIHFDFMPTFPVFNTADIMIVFGALGLVTAILHRK